MELSADDLKVRALCADAQYQPAVVAVLEAYGPELYSFLVARFPSKIELAEDAFSTFTERLLRTIDRFEWRCSVRTWCYKLARSAATHVGRSADRPGRRRVPLTEGGIADSLIQRARTTTALHMRTEVKDKVAELRAGLSDDDRELLTLRIDRNMSWREVAIIMLPGDEVTTADEDRRKEATLRQRFNEVKRRLRKLAVEAGII